jgi:DNA-binding NarL/FixJ family response regulator
MNTSEWQRPANVIIVHELPLMRRALRIALEADHRLCIVGSTAFDAMGMLLALDRQPDAILIDPAGDAAARVATIEALHRAAPKAAIIVMLSHEVVLDVGALRTAGASTFIDCFAHADEVLVSVTGWCNDLLRTCADRESCRNGGAAAYNGSVEQAPLATVDVELLRLVAAGQTDEQIARILFVSPRTVQKHLARVRAETSCANRSQLVAWYMRMHQPYVYS